MALKTDKLHQLKISLKKPEIKNVFISSYSPIKCGIANFTRDLTTVINMLNPNQLSRIVAVTPSQEEAKYPWEVEFEIHQENDEDYKGAVEYINQKKFDVVCLQHEYGIYGGDEGEKVLDLIKNIKIPLITTLHTILKTPSDKQKSIIKELDKRSKILVVMSQISKKRLASIYNVDPRKIVIVPLGIPDLPFSFSDYWKGLLGANGNFLVGTFGLLSPNKGCEYLIKALPAVLEKHPKVIAAIVGETHPKIKKWFDEKYRESLIKLTQKLGIEKKVYFLNQYFPHQELTYIVQAFDIFVAPYTNPQQISSAALSLAVGTGKACIATPFAHARELLGENRGILVPSKNYRKISEAINYLIENPEARQNMAQSSYLFGRKMTWVKVAESYLDLFRFVKNIYGR